ncbi:hypothetical protein QTP88_021039 [Uroleucon formosanum]
MIDTHLNIIQWNLNGFFKKREELGFLTQEYNPEIICLQETNFKENYVAPIKNYNGYSKNRQGADRASGGIAIYIKSYIPNTTINIQSEIEVLAVQVNLKENKKESWKKFTCSINNKTNSKELWTKIRSLKGLNRDQEIHIKDEHTPTSLPEEVAQKIGSFFYESFSNSIYKQKFIGEIKIPAENTPIQFDTSLIDSDQISLNATITLKEMNLALSKCKSKSPGPDEIPYCFLQNLGSSAKNYLLNLYNTIWRTGRIPDEWKKGIIIPIHKPGKDKHSVEGYRPITLLNTMTKVMEKIINNRLVWYLEKNKIISIEQSGFRRATSIEHFYPRKWNSPRVVTSYSVGIAIVAENTITTYKLPPECSIYTAEALAIYNATLHIIQNKDTTPNNYLVISDSLSSITGIQNITHPSDISKLIQEKTYEESDMGWIYAICGLLDTAAYKATKKQT